MKSRICEPEEMDDFKLPPEVHAHALKGLARLNRISFSAHSIWQALQKPVFSRRENVTPVHILDLATGGGDLPIALGIKAKKHGIPIQLSGADRSSFALSCARQSAEMQAVSVDWITLDITQDAIPPADWITCSLFLHHLPDPLIVSVFKKMMSAARQGIIINDLERTWINRTLVALGARLLSRSPIVHRDSDRSVCAGFTLPEISALATDAGLMGFEIRPCFPCRFQLIWTRPQH